MPDVSKIYWSLRALGRPDDAARLRTDWVAAGGGDPAAVRKLEETAEELKEALAALGASEEARRIREAALARARGSPVGRDADALRERTPRLLRSSAERAPAEPLPAPSAASRTGRAPTAAEALRRRLAAAEEADRARRARWRRNRRMRRLAAAVLILAGLAGGAALAAARRDDVAAGWVKAREQVAAAWGHAGGWVSRAFGSLRPSSPPAPETRPVAVVRAVVRAPPPATRPKAHARAVAARGAAAVAAAASSPASEGEAPPAPAALPDPVYAAREWPPRGGLGAVASLWRAETWGMTVDDVIRTVPGAVRAPDTARAADGLAALATVRPVVAAGESWTARFRFDGAGRLSEIQLFPADPGGSAWRARERLASALAAEHGVPSAEGSGPGARVRWRTGAATAELLGADADPGPTRVLFLDLAVGELRPVPEPVATLTIRPPVAQPAARTP